MNSKYFSFSDTVRSNTAQILKINNKPSDDILCNIEETAQFLDQMREEYGKPIFISSWYRCPELNEAVGGAKTSSHQYGYAADLYVKGNMLEFWNFCETYLEDKEFDELINEKPNDEGTPKWIHFSLKNKKGQQRKKVLFLK